MKCDSVLLHAAFLVAFSAMATACSNSQNPENSAAPAPSFPALQGFFSLEENRKSGQSELSMTAGFISSESRMVHELSLEEDRCFSSRQATPTSNRELPPQGIPAGQLVLNNNTETLVTLSAVDSSFSTQYILDGVIFPSTQVEELTLTVTGSADAFPALVSVQVPEIDSLAGFQIISNTGGSIGNVAWAASIYENTHLEMFINVDSETSSETFFCRAIDDGTFNPFDIIGYNASAVVRISNVLRARQTPYFIDDTYLLITRNSVGSHVATDRTDLTGVDAHPISSPCLIFLE